MKWTAGKIGVIGTIISFSIIVVVSFGIYPDIGEKILYGKHPPGKNSEFLEYSEIIISGNYHCMESASLEARGDLTKFVEEFNDCNG